ncbi:hypothetical protein Y1Q_0013048 [Alligator mississippiensis]|uniref:Uncharacterized protein n=1 Tax=Alligator mississippiensis TaxID=8496 RepID=A0A151N707_ALLMI|nr:hypothetical protein Y1Q_0013048 [Alligator mississippiensis]
MVLELLMGRRASSGESGEMAVAVHLCYSNLLQVFLSLKDFSQIPFQGVPDFSTCFISVQVMEKSRAGFYVHLE